MENLSDAFGWTFKDPQWVSKIILMGLIGLIPIVGQIVLFGWMLTALDNLRAGRQELPPAGFQYIGRGVNLFLVYLVYGLAIALTFAVLLTAGILLTSAGSGANGVGFVAALGVILVVLAWLIVVVGALVLIILEPVIILQTDRGGFSGGLDLPQAVESLFGTFFGETLLAGLMTVVARIIGGLGSILCGIGVILTTAYGYAIVAGVVRWYEMQVGGDTGTAVPTTPPQTPPPTPYPTS